jgi:hypothetical protein
MAKNDIDLLDRLRRAGVRKQVAKMLSEMGDDAGKKSVRAARSAVAELRSLVDEIERRLPSTTKEPRSTGRTAGRLSTRSPATTRRASRSRPAGGTGASGRSRRPVTQRKAAAAPTAKSGSMRATSSVRAPRGQNKANIIESLGAGPKTASEVAKETGISTGTVGSTLTKLATTGEVVKAERGYALPS